MDTKFRLIEKEYKDFHNSFLARGMLPMRSTDVGFWNASIPSEVFTAFKKLGLSRYNNFLDIGSGDGSVTLIASLFCRNAHGVEFDRELHNKAVEMQEKLGINNAVFLNDNYFNMDLSNFDVLFSAPDSPMARGLENKLLKEMKGHLIIYGYHFHPSNMKKLKEVKFEGNLITVYSK